MPTLRPIKPPTFTELNNRALEEPASEPEIIEVPPENALVPLADGSIAAKGFRLTVLGLVTDGDVTVEDWQQLGNTLSRFEQYSKLAIGDWIACGEQNFKVPLDIIAGILGKGVHTLQNYTWVAQNIPFSLRRENLSFAHYSLVASDRFTPENRDYWLNLASQNNWSVAQFRQMLNPPKTKSKRPQFKTNPAGYFEYELKRLDKKIEQLEPGQKRDLARALRRWAEQIEGGDE